MKIFFLEEFTLKKKKKKKKKNVFIFTNLEKISAVTWKKNKFFPNTIKIASLEI